MVQVKWPLDFPYEMHSDSDIRSNELLVDLPFVLTVDSQFSASPLFPMCFREFPPIPDFSLFLRPAVHRWRKCPKLGIGRKNKIKTEIIPIKKNSIWNQSTMTHHFHLVRNLLELIAIELLFHPTSLLELLFQASIARSSIVFSRVAPTTHPRFGMNFSTSQSSLPELRWRRRLCSSQCQFPSNYNFFNENQKIE